MEKQKLQQEIEKQRKEICDKTDEIQKLQNEITDMCHDVFELQAGVKELKNENKQLRELVCEFAHYLDCPAYFLRPETEKTIIGIAAEERSRKMSDNKFTDTLNQLLDQLETVKTEIEKQNARMKQMEASNAELLDVLEDFVIDVEGFFGFSEGDDMEPEDDIAYFIGEYCRAKRLIKKGKGKRP